MLYGRYKHEFDKSISDFTKAIEIDPKYVDAYVSRGMAYSYKNQFDNAIFDYTKVIELNSRNPDAYYNRATSYYYKEEYDRSWDDLYKAQGLGAKIDPNFIRDLKKASGRDK